jgi:probable phosphoglycerate mutase
MSVVHLVRHAEHDFQGRVLVGRAPGVSLNEAGRRQAGWLSERLATAPVAGVLSSPRERARETAEPIARRRALGVVVAGELDELDCGEWTGRPFAELAHDPLWQRWNRLRSTTRVPGGELMLEVQARIIGFTERLRQAHPEAHLVLVSHGDVIRAALLHYLAMPLDAVHRLVIAPGSLTTLLLGEGEPQLLRLNEAADVSP